MTWFDVLTGFSEQGGDDVRAKLRLDGTRFTSNANNRTFDAGAFSTPSLSDLRGKTKPGTGQNIRVAELVGDVRSLHLDIANANAVFQVASQFNCLEMAAPHVIPEAGVGIYENDWTQGPACSICAGAGTIYRNYFADVNGVTGQTHNNQIDCLSEIGRYFGSDAWQMQNGYCFPTPSGLSSIEIQLSLCREQALDDIRGRLKVGVQAKTQVTIGDATHMVTQVFCSALPIAYSDIPTAHWNYFPRLILDATYEATFHVALQNLADTGCPKLYLTLVGGGVFGNKLAWILSSIGRSLKLFAWANLDVYIVSYGSSKPEVVSFLACQNAE
ncbi:MAG: hypothetical protein AAGD25_07320 [Cyanobacteria bacterium P01_F01_bin.150]